MRTVDTVAHRVDTFRLLSTVIPALLAGLLLFLMGCAAPERPSGPVVAHVTNVHDGDTVMVLYHGGPERIRLYGIDCPEKEQPYGQEATDEVSHLLMNQNVTVEEKGRDRYGRLLAILQLSDGRFVNQELVRTGACWWYQKYASRDRELERLEGEAKAAHTGLWASSNPIAPWEWRKQHRNRLSTTPFEWLRSLSEDE